MKKKKTTRLMTLGEFQDYFDNKKPTTVIYDMTNDHDNPKCGHPECEPIYLSLTFEQVHLCWMPATIGLKSSSGYMSLRFIRRIEFESIDFFGDVFTIYCGATGEKEIGYTLIIR